MVNGVESKPEQNLALGQGVIDCAAQLDDMFTFCISRGKRKVGNTLVLAAQFPEFDDQLRGKGNPAHVGKSDFTGPKLHSCTHETSVGVKV